jgi:ethanolamine ammonia-lyase small subunit
MRKLAEFTNARVDLGQAGDSLPTTALLEFRLAHARARDAVHLPLDTLSMVNDLAAAGWQPLVLTSQAATRQEYLLRPDLGRRLSNESQQVVRQMPKPHRLALVVTDGLSALAVHRHAVNLLHELQLEEVCSIFLVQMGRVAIGDHIGELLDAELCVLLIGERPGLSSPDSLGVYLTWRPHLGRTDAERNCVSNIHDQGLSYELAAAKLSYLMAESQRLKLSGVALKEREGEIAGHP